MAPTAPDYEVVRIEAGAGTGDRVFVLETPSGYRFRVEEPLGTHRVEVIRGDKNGPTKVRLLR